jgi:hypothetical protein
MKPHWATVGVAMTAIAFAGLGGAASVAQDNASTQETTMADTHRTDWFKDAKWGVFTHYMADTVLKADEISVDAWNAAVDSFDAEAWANQLASVGAGYTIITLGQNSGYYCSPNAVYDKYVGISPSKCSNRDLIADCYEALRPHGIRLMVYLPSGAPDRDPVAMEALEWKFGKYPLWSHPDGGPDGGDPRLESFQRKWEDVIREWSLRWGDKVSRWWFDGCYFPHAMYYHPDPPNFESFAAAARAGNPGSIVAFNPGVRIPIITMTPYEDYAAGEINEPDKVTCAGRWIEGPDRARAQFHMLSYLGPSWAQSPPRFTDEQAIAFTRTVVDHGGVVSWDVPILANGRIPDPFFTQLTSIGNALKR